MLPVSVKLYAAALVLVTLAAGIEVHRRNVMMRERSRFGLLKDDVELFVDALSTSMRNPESCRRIFAGLPLKIDAAEPVELNYAFDPAAPPPLKAGRDAWPGTQFKRLNLRVPADPDVRVRYRDSNYRRFRARLEAEFVVKDRFARGIPAGLELFLWVDAEGKVADCFGPLSVGSVCNMMGGYYDVDARDGEPRCHQLLNTIVGSGKAEALRGSCRVSALVARAPECASKKGALPFQDQMGYGTRAQTLCRVCE